MEERNIETTTCASCGETVLSTEKFCKNCGKPLGQKSEKMVVKENPNKKFVLTFEVLDDKSIKNAYGQVLTYTYSIEVDGDFIGKINHGEKIDTFVAKGKHNIKIKRNQSFIPNEGQITVENNQTILLYNKFFYGFYFPDFLRNSSDEKKEEILQRNKKVLKIGNEILLIFIAVSLLFILVLFLLV